jgi:hypothetical protein
MCRTYYEGYLESVSPTGVVTGWAIDYASPDHELDIHFYIGNVPGSPDTFLGAAKTDLVRDDVNADKKTSGAHGFVFRIPENRLDRKFHTIAAFIFIPSNPGYLLSGSPSICLLIPSDGISLIGDSGNTSVRFRFHNGGRPGSGETIQDYLFPGYPSRMEGGVSPFRVMQWGKDELLCHSVPANYPVSHPGFMQPSLMFLNTSSTYDSFWNQTAMYSFPTVDNRSHLWIYFTPLGRKPVFELYGEHGGFIENIGGSNVFLETDVDPNVMATMDKPTELALKAKIKSAVQSYSSEDERSSGIVKWQFFSAFTFTLTNPVNQKTTNLFLQILHAYSHGNSDENPTPYRNHTTQDGAVFTGLLNTNHLLRSAAPQDPLKPMLFNLNQYLIHAISDGFPRNGDQRNKFFFEAYAQDLANWRLNSFYIGIETQSQRIEVVNTNGESRKIVHPRGSVSAAAVAVQISEIYLTQYTA